MDENSVQSPGFISRLKNRLAQVDQRTAFDAFLILLIVVGLIATVYLAGQRQIFRSRAAGGSADVVNEQGQALPKNEDGSVTVETPQIRLKIDFPTDWSQGALPSIVNSTYAQTKPLCTNIFYKGRPTVCADASGNMFNNLGKTCGPYLSDYDSTGCEQMYPNYKYCFVEESCPTTAPTSTPTPTQPPAAQTCQQDLNGYCARSDGVPRDNPNLKCSGYLGYRGDGTGKFSDCDTTFGAYPYCYTKSSCTPVATPTTTQTQPVDTGTSTPTIGTILRDANGIIIPGANFGSGGVVWYSPGGKEENRLNNADLVWGPSGIRIVNIENIPGGYARVCRTDGQCSNYVPIPNRQATVQSTPTLTPVPRVGGPPPPTATPVPEQTLYIQVSLKQDKLGKDKCTDDSDLRQKCQQISVLDLAANQNIFDWKLPPTQNESYTIFIGFISDKGNPKPNPLQVKATYRPKQVERVGGPPGPQPTKEQKPSCNDNGEGGLCASVFNKEKGEWLTQRGDICRNAINVSTAFDCSTAYPGYEYCISGSNLTCSPQSTTHPDTTALKLSGYCSDDGTELNFSWNPIPSTSVYDIYIYSSPGNGVKGFENGFQETSQSSYKIAVKPGFSYTTVVTRVDSTRVVQQRSNELKLTCVTSSPQSTLPPKPQAANITCDKLFDDCKRTIGIEEGATEEKCSTIKGQCEFLQSQTGVVGGLTSLGEAPPTPTPTGPSANDKALCTTVRSVCMGDADSTVEGTFTRCKNIYSYCLDEQGYKNQDELWKRLNNECLQQYQECKNAFITGGLFSGQCRDKRDSCSARVKSLNLR